MTATEISPTIVPNFGDEDEVDRKLVIICSKGNLDMAYPGLILANAALGEGIETHLFFTFWGLDMILRSRMDDLQFTPVGNTAMHLPVGDSRIPQFFTAFPGMQGMSTKMMKKQIADLGVPEVPDLLEQIVAAGGHLWACRMSVDMMKVRNDDMYDGVEGVINATDFMEMSAGGQLLFI